MLVWGLLVRQSSGDPAPFSFNGDRNQTKLLAASLEESLHWGLASQRVRQAARR